jgi:DNA-binding MarR family transcriptional regulator
MTDLGRPRRRNSVLEALVRLRRRRPGVNLTEAIIFLYVAENPGLNVAELARLIGMTLATASRAARGLAGEQAQAPALLEIQGSPVDLRGRRHFLSRAGIELAEELETVIGRADPIASPLRRLTHV